MSKLERKFAKFTDLKTLDDDSGPGGFEGHASISGNLDDGGDIILDGSFKEVIDSFLRSGFTAHSHEWDIKDGVIGYPMEAYEDDDGFFVSMKFHSTDDAQKVRTKMRERIADGKDVGLSIGYRPGSPKFIYPKDFEKELPKYLKPRYLTEGLAKAKQFKFVRVIPAMAELKEFSVVTSPMNQESQVLNVKSGDEIEEKIGARNSSMDKSAMQAIHDQIVKLEPSVCSGYSAKEIVGEEAEPIAVKDIFSEEMARRAEPKPYQIWDAFSTTLYRIKKLKCSGLDSMLDTSTLLDEAITAMTDQLRSAAKAELDDVDSEMGLAFYGREFPTEAKTTEPVPAIGDAPVVDEVVDDEPVAEVKDEASKVEAVDQTAEGDEAKSANKVAYAAERFRFEKSKTNALRQRARLVV
jgi:HK97 family phage prohead protease